MDPLALQKLIEEAAHKAVARYMDGEAPVGAAGLRDLSNEEAAAAHLRPSDVFTKAMQIAREL